MCRIAGTVVAIVLVLVAAVPALAAGTYHDSLVAGDKALMAGKADDALAEYGAALGHSTSAGERALALGKKAYVLAYLTHDYTAARAAVSEGMAVKDLAPVARVTLLQVLAHCQMKADKNFMAAKSNLEEALTLEGVDWARPGLLLALGDCQREVGNKDDALATYAKVLALDNADVGAKAGAHICSGFIYQYDRRDAAKARECYAKVLELRPELKDEIDGHLGRLP